MPSLPRFLRAWSRGDPSIGRLETTYDRHGVSLPATVWGPQRTGRLPGWVLLHGLTFTGREHPSLERFARALAASGARVLVPDIPEWRALHVAPAITHETIRAAVQTLHERPDIDPQRIGLIGFSFGATQALIAAADPAVSASLRGIAAWGGYSDVRRLFVFGITGEYDLDGVSYGVCPDPYGAWVMAGNYLTKIPGHEHESDIATAVHELAREAGRRRIYADDPVYDPMKAELRAALPSDRWPVFDLIAAPAGKPPDDVDAARSVALQLADAALKTDPLLDPGPFLKQPGPRVLLAHGRDDRLVPWTESMRLARALAPGRLTSTTITGLFQHSGGTNRRLGPAGLMVESTRFLRVLRRILRLI
jgi:acetyl esterase/lipase